MPALIANIDLPADEKAKLLKVLKRKQPGAKKIEERESRRN